MPFNFVQQCLLENRHLGYLLMACSICLFEIPTSLPLLNATYFLLRNLFFLDIVIFIFLFFFTHCSTVKCALISCNISSLKCETSYSLSETHIFTVWFGSDFMFSLSSFIKKYLHSVSFQDAICNQHSKGYCIVSLYIFFFSKLISSITIIQLSLESAWHRPVVKAIRVKKQFSSMPHVKSVVWTNYQNLQEFFSKSSYLTRLLLDNESPLTVQYQFCGAWIKLVEEQPKTPGNPAGLENTYGVILPK